MQLRTLTDNELLRHAHTQLDPLTGTDLEAELVRRFDEKDAEIAYFDPIEEVLDEFDLTDSKSVDACKAALQFGVDYDVQQAKKLLDVLTEYDIDVQQAKKLLDVLTEYDIDDPAVLRKELIRLAQFDEALA